MDQSLPWKERRKARADMTRLLSAMIAAGVIDAEERRLVAAHIQRRLEATTPRFWQKVLSLAAASLWRTRSERNLP